MTMTEQEPVYAIMDEFFSEDRHRYDLRGMAAEILRLRTALNVLQPDGSGSGLTLDDLLRLLDEECHEVIAAAAAVGHAACKALRFGFDVDHGTGYGNNRLKLSREVGQLLAVIDALPLDPEQKTLGYAEKLEKARAAKRSYPKAET